MNTKDVKLFTKLYDQVNDKINEIRKLPKLFGEGEYYDGWGFDWENGETVICIKSSDRYGDSYSFHFPVSELSNSIEQFRDKFQKEIEDYSRNIELEKEKRAEESRVFMENAERMEYERLKEKYEND